jgi:hypothetical protein
MGDLGLLGAYHGYICIEIWRPHGKSMDDLLLGQWKIYF